MSSRRTAASPDPPRVGEIPQHHNGINDQSPINENRTVLNPDSKDHLKELQDTKEQLQACRKQLEELQANFHESEKQRTMLFMDLPVAMYATDANGKITHYNTAAAELWGREPAVGIEEFSGAFRIFDPEGNPILHNESPTAKATREKKAVKNAELIFERADGTRRNIISNPQPLLDPQGNVATCVTTFLDITDRKKAENLTKKSEATLKLIIENTRDAHVIIDNEAKIIAYNTVALVLYEKITGKQLAEGKSMYDYLHPEYKEWLAGHYEKIAQGEIFENDLVRTGTEGKTYFLKEYTNAVTSSDGRTLGICITRRDTTAEVGVQAAVKNSEASLRALFDNAKDGFVLLSPDEKIIAFNHTSSELYQKMYGKVLEVGKSAAETLGPQVSGYVHQAFMKVLAGESLERKSWQLAASGVGYWLRGNYNPVKSPEGNIIGICMGIADITSEVEANDYAAQLAAIVESSEDAIVGKTLEGIVTSWNAGAQRIFGYEPYEMIGQSITKLIPPERLEEEPKILEQLKQGRRVSHFETIRVTKSGEHRNISLTISPIRNDDGHLIGASKIARDITDQKKLEEKLRETEQMFRVELEKNVLDRTQELKERNEEVQQQKEFIETVVESSVDLIAVYDTEMRVLSINKQVEKLLGLKRQKVIGKTYLELFPGARGSETYQNLLRALAGEQTHHVLPRGESGRAFDVFMIPLTHNTRVYAVLVLTHDITEIMDISEKLRIANTVLEEKNTALERTNSDLEQFAYIASHDLQEPLRKIRMFTGLMKEKPETLDESAQEYLAKIIKSSDRMSELIKDILLYSRLTNVHAAFQKTDLNKIVKNIISDFDLTIEERKARVHIGTLPVIDGISQQLSQLLSNLLNNSLKFSHEGIAPEISISSKRVPPGEIQMRKLNGSNTYFDITVKDNGIGFNKSFAEKIFVIFQRLNDRSRFEGTGIGLALCRKIVTLHGGEIYAESIEGQGAEFHILLPEKQH